MELLPGDTGDSTEKDFDDNQSASLPEQRSLEEQPFVEAALPVTPTMNPENFTVEEDLLLVSAWLETSMDAVQDNEQSRGRAESFTEKEDNLLVLAWLNTSDDAVHGNEQSHSTRWQRIHDYFHAHKDFESDRGVNSLMHRWDIIVESVDRFCGWYAQIENRGQSSMAEQDKVLQACQLYKDTHNQSFSLLHCWNILRREQKWNDRSSEQKTTANSSQGSCTSGSDESFYDEDDDDYDDDDDDDEDDDDDDDDDNLVSYMEVLENWRAKRKEAEELKEIQRKARHDELMALQEKRLELQKKRLELEKKDLELRRRIEDDRIMLMDLSGMDEQLKQFYKGLQNEIFARYFGGGKG